MKRYQKIFYTFAICKYLIHYFWVSLSERVFGVMMVLPSSKLKILLTYFCFSAKTVNYIRGSCDKFYPQLNISGKHIEAFVKVISMTDMLLLNLLSEYVCHFILQIKIKGKGLKKSGIFQIWSDLKHEKSGKSIFFFVLKWFWANLSNDNGNNILSLDSE